MWRATVDPPWDVDAWRAQARAALMAGIAPEMLDWSVSAGGLLAATPVETAPAIREAPRVGRAFLDLARHVLAHRDGDRHALMYRLLWRIAEGERDLLDFAADPDVRRAQQLEKAVTRDAHKAKAFVRFREVPGEANTFVAWYEPDHQVLDLVAPFFMRRFAGMRWAIVTPERSATWDGTELAMGGGGSRGDVPPDDAGEALWRRYYASIFNPARLNPRAMRAEMPQRFWRGLPEAQELPRLMREAGERVHAMVERAPEPPRRVLPAPVFAPAPTEGLAGLAAAVRACRGCPLWQPATQAVAGEGPADAPIVFIGEQPGDEEDLTGRPFTGPAGRLFDRALADIGVDRGRCYVTNAVKHFKFQQRGKRRLHERANAAEQQACRPWLERELALLRPRAIVCLGATAAQALMGRSFALMRERGTWQQGPGGVPLLATVHPSWVLRQPMGDGEAAYAGFIEDLARVLPHAGDAIAA
ncbi:UdgX family uracil-DNA binding protein [Lysobacter humi (ex Lee et al. 2017)]